MMIYALGFSIFCHLMIVGVALFAPEYVYKIINRLHKNNKNNNRTQMTENNNTIKKQDNENGIINISKNNSNKDDVSNYKDTKQQDTNLKTNKPSEENSKRIKKFEVQKVDPVVKHFIKQPQTENQMLEWFKKQNYNVSTRNGFCNVTMHIKKPAPSKPTIISINLDGTVVPSYQHNDAVLANNYGSTTTTGGRATVVNDGFNTSAFAKYEMGSWWIEITHAFDWNLEQESVKEIWLKAKKIKLINDEI